MLAVAERGLRHQITETTKRIRSPKKRGSPSSRFPYFENRSDHMHVADHLAEGRSIGSGQIEGVCKNRIGRQLQQTCTRWKVLRVNRIASFRSIMSRDLWKSYRNAKQSNPSRCETAPHIILPIGRSWRSTYCATIITDLAIHFGFLRLLKHVT